MYTPEQTETIIVNMRLMIDSVKALKDCGLLKTKSESDFISLVPEDRKPEVKALLKELAQIDTGG